MAHLGSTLLAVTRHGRGAVVVVRGAGPAQLPRHGGPVVVGVDGSPSAAAAVGIAFAEAAERRTRLVAVDTSGPRLRLLAWSTAAQLVVVGSRGRGGFRGLLLGSTSNSLVQHADCPVIRSPGSPRCGGPWSALKGLPRCRRESTEGIWSPAYRRNGRLQGPRNRPH